MKRLGNVYHQLTSFANLLKALHNACRGKKSKYTIRLFVFNQENELTALQRELQNKSYRPRPYTTFEIHDPKKRTISAAHFRDRVVHHAVCNIIAPWLERFFIYDSYACRPGKGTHRAIARAQKFSRGYRYFLKCDVRKFFDSIDHHQLQTILRRKFKDPDLLWLIQTIIASTNTDTNKGLPIGNLTSQYFANLYLNELDHYLKQSQQVKAYVRYMDDLALYANSKDTLRQLHQQITDFLANRLKLQLKPKATLLRPTWEGLPFLGFRIFPGTCKIQRQNWQRFKKKFLKRQHQYQTNRLSADQATQSIASLLGHIRHGDTWQLRKKLLQQRTIDF